MNKDDLRSQLEETFRQMKISYHKLLFDDIVQTISGSGNEKKFIELLYSRLLILSQQHHQAIQLHPKKFESMTGEKNLYSIRLIGKNINHRILYSYDGSEILLMCFHERAGKANTDYSSAIRVARSRFEELKGR